MATKNGKSSSASKPTRASHIELGYALSSEEHKPNDLVRNAQRAEQVGFTFGLISDHFHPWTNQQGNSPFVWSILGAIASTTKTFRIGTGVTCPLVRIHPAIIAQSAATIASMMPGRFFLGVGTGENLNEHILGDKWYPSDLRREMLDEAVELIRELWQGDSVSHYARSIRLKTPESTPCPTSSPKSTSPRADPRQPNSPEISAMV